MWKRMKFLKGENCSLVTEKKALSTSILTGKTKESGFAMLSIETNFKTGWTETETPSKRSVNNLSQYYIKPKLAIRYQ